MERLPLPARGSEVAHEEARFETTTRDLLALAAWLEARGITHVVMEATGGVLEVGAAHSGGGLDPDPGQRARGAQSARPQEQYERRALAGRFPGPRPGAGELHAARADPGMRDLTRTRQQLTRQMVQHQNRIAKVLEDANIKLFGVVSDLIGKNSRRILEALEAAESVPVRLAALADHRLKATPAELAAAQEGRFTRHHAFLMREHLAMIDHLAERIAGFERELEPLHPSRTGWGLAEAAADPVRLGSGENEEHVPVPSVRRHRGPARGKESRDDGRRLDPDRHLPHDPRLVSYRPPEPRSLDAAAKAIKARHLAGHIRALGFAAEMRAAA